MYTRVVAAQVGFVVAKFVPLVAEVGLVRTWAGRSAEHTSSAATWFVATATRVEPAIIAIDLVAGSFPLLLCG